MEAGPSPSAVPPACLASASLPRTHLFSFAFPSSVVSQSVVFRLASRGASTSYPFLLPTTCKVNLVGKTCFSDPFSINKHSPVSHCSHKPHGRLITGHSRRWYRNERRSFLSWHGPYQRSFHCRQNKIGGHICRLEIISCSLFYKKMSKCMVFPQHCPET